MSFLTRTGAPPEDAIDLLDARGESAALWLCLRKHLASADAIFVLKTLKEHSTWPIGMRTDAEKERRAYLHLWRECKHYDPEWVHAEMEQRKSRLRGPEADGSRFQ